VDVQFASESVALAPPLVSLPVADAIIGLRTAGPDDVGAIHALIEAHQDEGHLLPRARAEIEARVGRFVVAADGHGRLVGCAELAPLSGTVAEVRSLVVHADARHDGVGRRLVDELVRRASVQGFDRLCAFTHGPGYFMRLGFSLVPHHWVREKIAADCQGCALFRRCGQHAVLLSLADAPRARASRA
jgi:amino-acid N-acetyltransferase